MSILDGKPTRLSPEAAAIAARLLINRELGKVVPIRTQVKSAEPKLPKSGALYQQFCELAKLFGADDAALKSENERLRSECATLIGKLSQTGDSTLRLAKLVAEPGKLFDLTKIVRNRYGWLEEVTRADGLVVQFKRDGTGTLMGLHASDGRTARVVRRGANYDIAGIFWAPAA